MHAKARYYLAFTLPLVTLISLVEAGYWSYGTLILAFVLIPSLELILPPDESGPTDKAEETSLAQDPFYDLLLYAMVPTQYALLGFFMWRLVQGGLSGFEITGMVLSMGIHSGAVGINVAHELGHRQSRFERTLARLLLLSSLYLHFIVEHNRGHHKHVGTPKDPASARFNESIYAFWLRTIIGSFRSAWGIERGMRMKHQKPVWSLGNEMVRLVVIESGLVIALYVGLGLTPTIMFVLSSLVGILLLETVNYIEHYGLRRRMREDGSYEKVQPWHSWNSNYPVGRILLFELTRHSDHHFKASKKYQLLRHLTASPQLPSGYPGMMLLSLVPPLWFRMVNPRIAELNQQLQSGT